MSPDLQAEDRGGLVSSDEITSLYIHLVGPGRQVLGKPVPCPEVDDPGSLLRPVGDPAGVEEGEGVEGEETPAEKGEGEGAEKPSGDSEKEEGASK